MHTFREPTGRKAMPVIDTMTTYTRTAIVLHWTLALLLTAMTALGWYMTSIEAEPGSAWFFNMHKSIGLVTALLIAARLVWRLTHQPPNLPASMPTWQTRLSRWSHVVLYLVMVFMPITGYLGASYSNAGVHLFGIGTPHWALPDHDEAERLFGLHSVLVWVLVAVVGIHILGACKHLLLDGDGVFQRMWFRQSNTLARSGSAQTLVKADRIDGSLASSHESSSRSE